MDDTIEEQVKDIIDNVSDISKEDDDKEKEEKLKELEEEFDIDEINEQNSKFIEWIQSFTKTIVSTFSILYIIITIIFILMLMYELSHDYIEGLSTMISEINETFRVVIGGYLIKAGLENSFKITGSILSSINKQKLGILDEDDEDDEASFEEIESFRDDEDMSD